MKHTYWILASILLISSRSAAQQLHDPDAPASVPMIATTVDIDVDGQTETADKDFVFLTWPTDYKDWELHHSQDVINPLISQWGDQESRQDGAWVYPVDIPLIYEPLKGTPDKFQTVFSVKEGYDVYTRLDQTESWQQGAIFEGVGTTEDSTFQFLIKRQNEKGALGGKASRVYNGFVGLKIALGFLANGQSAGYMLILDPRRARSVTSGEPQY